MGGGGAPPGLEEPEDEWEWCKGDVNCCANPAEKQMCGRTAEKAQSAGACKARNSGGSRNSGMPPAHRPAGGGQARRRFAAAPALM